MVTDTSSNQKLSIDEEIEQILRPLIEEIEPRKPNEGVGRPRILPAMCLWGGLLLCVLRGLKSQRSIWRLLSSRGLWGYDRFEISDEAVYKRLEKGGTKTLQHLFKLVSEKMRERITPYVETTGLGRIAPFAEEIVAFDVMTLDKVARTLPVLRRMEKGADTLLPGKMAAVFSIRRQQWHHLQYVEDVHENEKKTARRLLSTVEVGTLILADLGYFGFAWFDQLTKTGYWWISRLRKRTSYEVIHTFYEEDGIFDGIVWLGKYRSDQAAHAVRLLIFPHKNVVYRYITNVLDPHQLSMHDVASLYARRWDIELAFKLIKRELGLHLLWSAKIVVILQQVWAVLIISQILQALRMEIAGRAKVDPFDVSLKLMIEYLPQARYDGQSMEQMITLFVEQGERLGFIRPSRRTRIHTPTIPPAKIKPKPPDLILLRRPRYAQRRC